MVMETRSFTEGLPPSEQEIREFEASLRGRLVRPGNEDYDLLRGVWNGAYDRHPSFIARPANAQDVAQTVRFARRHALPLAIRSGGHSMAGFGTVEGGMLLDMRDMKRLEIDADRRVSRAEPGLTWGEYTTAAAQHGLATPAGDVGSVGIGGLTVGGGIGWLVRKYGLTIDSLLAIDVVTADGRQVRASETENADLFWAMRGGGGNFGIATGFEFRLHPVGMIVGGMIAYPLHEARSVLRGWADYAAAAPEELSTICYVMEAPPAPGVPPEAVGQPIIAIAVCYTGDLEEGQRVVEPLRRLGTVAADLSGPMPYPVLYEMTKEASETGIHHAVRSLYMRSLSDETIETIETYFAARPSPISLFQLRVLGGAMSRVPADATAFSHRDAHIMAVVGASWEEGDGAPHVAWAEQFFNALRPYSDGVYVNFLADDGEARIREAYSAAAFERLTALKRKYDPTNVFHLNQNIKPTA